MVQLLFKWSLSPLSSSRMLCKVPGMNKNLVFVAMLEDRGYNVIFNKGKGFLRHIAMEEVKQIGVQMNNLYKLDVEDYAELRKKAEKVQS